MIINFLKPSYWFSFDYAVVDGVGGKIVFATFLVLVLIGIFSRMVAEHKTDDKYMKIVGRKFSNIFVTMGFVGMLFFFFSFEHISFFGARFWYLIWLIGVAVWIFYLVRFVRKDVPEKRKKDLAHVERMKYMPPRKKKKKK